MFKVLRTKSRGQRCRDGRLSSFGRQLDQTHILPYRYCKMTKSATVEQSAPNKPPKLTAGEITPQVACDWETACETYFLHKAVTAADQVKMIASGMTDPRLRTWYLNQRATLDAGTFKDYMKALRGAWLESHWANKL
jgi:hypothetical protein